MQLKMPPERAALLAESLQRDIANSAPDSQVKELSQILVWLRYRIQRWEQHHPETPAA
jgi:hypothetical protein